jgi:hypothetical protein
VSFYPTYFYKASLVIEAFLFSGKDIIMAWNGLGSFLRLFSWSDDAANSINISSSRMDSEFSNYKAGLENCITRDGQNQPIANLPMGTFRHTAVGAASARDQYARVAEIQDGGYIWGGTAGGTANALTLSLTPAITVLTAGQTVRFVTGVAANSGAATLAVSGLAATAIVKDGGAALVAGDLPLNSLIEVVYNGTNYRLNRTSGTSLIDVVHLTGAETIAGVKTFSNIPVASAGITIASGGLNIAAGGASVVGNANFSGGTVVGPDALAANQFATKGQLDAKVYGGTVTNNGTTATLTYGPSGWSVSRTGTGLVTVTHNLGTTNYAATLGTMSSGPQHQVQHSQTSNTILVETRSSGGFADLPFSFTVARN